MSNFKLIGIRPHKGCSEDYLKVLEPGRLYQFYNEYEFYTKDGKFDGVNGEITHYEIKKTVPEDLYKVGNLNVNISAVVGKNGTGKSSLIELLLYGIYSISSQLFMYEDIKLLNPYTNTIKLKIESNNKIKKKYEDLRSDLVIINNQIKQYLRASKEKQVAKLYKKYVDKQNEISILKFDKKEWTKYDRYLKSSLLLAYDEHNDILKKMKCSIMFISNSDLFELVLDRGIQLFKFDDNIKGVPLNPLFYSEILESFFYSIFLNYSHHSLNSNFIGDWINTLFHKNDGYKTPAVINPMREEGNFDINKEIELAKNRLLTNLLIKRFKEVKEDEKDKKTGKVKVTEKQYVQYVSFKFNKENTQRNLIKLGDKNSKIKNEDFLISGNSLTTNLVLDFLSANDDIFDDYQQVELQNNKLPFVKSLFDYIAYKVPRILKNYPKFGSKDNEINHNEIDLIHFYRKSLYNLKKDSSHVTFKYHRVVHFLKKIVDQDILKWKTEEEKVYFTLDELLSWMKIEQEEDLYEINRRIPPPIFELDFVFENEDIIRENNNTELDKLPKLSDLSSGEQQSIHSINALLYHINNGYSIHKKEDKTKEVLYKNFNVIFDEIELYFHPDLQRRFISDLLKTLKSYSYLVDGKYIKGLNILFSTHSPFILSDIPKQNILQLENNYSEQTKIKKKFSISLSLKRQTFGANIHDLLSNSFFLDNSYKGKFAEEYFNQIIDEIKAINSNLTEQDYINWSNKVNLIAEPFIKAKLFEMLDSKFVDIINPIDEKIKRMEEAIEQLKIEKKKNKEKDDTDKSR